MLAQKNDNLYIRPTSLQGQLFSTPEFGLVERFYCIMIIWQVQILKISIGQNLLNSSNYTKSLKWLNEKSKMSFLVRTQYSIKANGYQTKYKTVHFINTFIYWIQKVVHHHWEVPSLVFFENTVKMHVQDSPSHKTLPLFKINISVFRICWCHKTHLVFK